MSARRPFERTLEQLARLTAKELARLRPADRARLEELERGKAQGTLSTIQLDEHSVRQQLHHAQLLLSFGQRMQVGTVSETEQSRALERYRRWQTALEGTRGAVHAVDRKLARLGVQFAEGVVHLPKVGKLLAELTSHLKTVLDYAASLPGPRGPLEDGRLAAVTKKLEAISKELELDPPLTHTDFWKTTRYQHRSTFEHWLETGGSKNADTAFRKSVELTSAEFMRRREAWRPRKKPG